MNARNIESFYPLSPMQQGMLFHSRLAPQSGVYVEQVQCTLRGDLQVAAFEQAWQDVMARHAILRTSFVGEKLKEPVQIVHRDLEVPLEILDWRHLSRDEQQSRLEARAASERAQGFDLTQAPLLRLALVRTTDETHEFLWTYHHILLDGWSQPLLYQEVFSLYEAHIRGEELALAPSRAYRDYIVWLKRQDMAAAETFWRNTLEGFDTPTPLATARPLNAVEDQPECYAEAEINVPAETTAALQAFARQHGFTLNTLVQAGWALLLGRYSDEDDVLFGVTVSGRPTDLPGADTMIGLFINTLPLRVRLDESAPVQEWLKSLRTQQGELQQYQYTPLIQIHEWSELSGSQPLFESILVFENYPTDMSTSSPALSLQIENVRSVEQTNYPLTAVAGVADELMLKIVYDERRFDPAAIQRMLGHWTTLLEGMMERPDQEVASLPLLTDAERQQLLVDWQATETPFPETRCVYELFAAQVDRTPDAVAVVFEDQSLTYRQLDRRANRLAHHLRSLDVGAETVVGLCVERSLEMIVGLWGILKAGGAYLPLDPSYPPERLAFMIEDAQTPVVLTQEALQERLPADDVAVVCLDSDWEQIAQASTTRPAVNVTPEDLAYVIYTSGSTGKPKGTLLEHRGLTNFATGWQELTGLDTESRVLQFLSYGFDGSFTDFFPTPLVGATLHLVPEELRLQPVALARYMQDQGITHVNMTPSMLSVLPNEAYPALKTVVVGGEVCPRELVARWLPGPRFINAYGPTEATVAASYYALNELPETLDVIPIGRPLSNVRLYVLDAQGRPLPVGVPGELVIGGVGVARGYLNRPNLTAKHFVPDPFSDEPGARMYHTGDRARYQENGDLEFLGRMDQQVKLRGFRVELGEIEAVLTELPEIQQAAVTVHGANAGREQLVAYVVPAAEEPSEIPDLQAWLGENLPAYMMPSTTVTLDTLPLTPSGKIDRRALPEPDVAASSARETTVRPRDALELQLTRIWEEILDIHPVGVKDDFFELGGHSLLAMRLIAVLQEELDVNVPIMSLFQEPTIEQLASAIRQQDEGATTSSVVPIQPEGDNPPLFFIHPSGGSVHWYADLAHHLGKDWPFYGIQARGLQGDDEIHTRVEEMASYYIKAIKSVQPNGPYFLGSWSMGVVIAFEIAQQLKAMDDDVKLLALLDQGPVLPKEEPEDEAAYLIDTFGKHVPLDVEALRQLDADAQIAHVWKKAREVDWIYPDVTLPQFSHFVRMLQTQTDAWRAYVPRPYPGRITLFRARRQSDHAPDSPDMGWSELALDGVEVIQTPGDHLSMIHNPRARILARKLGRVLTQINGR